MKQYDLGVFVGRFQPWHKGHRYCLDQALKLAKEVVILIGSIQEEGTEENPLSFEQRKQMLERIVGNKVVGIGGIEDYPSDEVWVEAVKAGVERLVGKVEDWSRVVVVGNNEWTNRTLAEIGGLAVLEPGLWKREWYEGKKIRRMIREGDERWKELVEGF